MQLRCPGCAQESLDVGTGSASCARCGASFPVEDDVVDLLRRENGSGRRSIAQHLMQARPVVRIYESRLWRRSTVFRAATGLSFEREQTLVMEALGLSGAERVLDLACGSGIYTRAMAARVARGHVVGIDMSLPMLRRASLLGRREGLGNLTWVRGNAMKLPLADSSIDAACCCGALHLFPDPPRAVAELGRVLVPGARLGLGVVSVGGKGLAGVMARLALASLGVTSLAPDALGAWLASAGFGPVTTHHVARTWLICSTRKK